MHPTTPFDSAPEPSLQAIRAFQGPVLVDLDETLYLRNSTEDFLDCATPSLAALFLFKLLDFFKPWRLTGGAATRDVWRVRAIRLFAPWVMPTWRRKVTDLAQRFGNQSLAAALNSRAEKPIISTVGFQPIVMPLIAALGFGDARVICARTTFEDRRNGKLLMVEKALGTNTVSNSLVVTDSADDLPLLSACARPLRTIWPTAYYRTALSGMYLPGRYLSKIKRPNERYIWRGILQEDFALWLLASVPIALQPLMVSLGLALLLVSFWAIYERGYVDNDRVAAKWEEDPKLNSEFHDHSVATSFFQPWIWALLFGAGGVYLVTDTTEAMPWNLARWVGVLVFTELWFRAYNRMDKGSRIWMYAVLQVLRSAAFVVIVPVTLVGALGLAAHTLSRWVPYYIYRIAGKDWPKKLQSQLVRTLFVLVLVGSLAAGAGVSAVVNVSGGLLLAWCLFRARHEIRDAIRAASRLTTRPKAP